MVGKLTVLPPLWGNHTCNGLDLHWKVIILKRKIHCHLAYIYYFFIIFYIKPYLLSHWLNNYLSHVLLLHLGFFFQGDFEHLPGLSGSLMR